MRISHIFAAVLLAVTALAAGEAVAFSMQNAGPGSATGSSAGSGASTNYLDAGDKLMQGMLGSGETGPGSQLEQQGNQLGTKSGFSMRMESTGRSDPVGGRYFSTDTNPWK